MTNERYKKNRTLKPKNEQILNSGIIYISTEGKK